MPRKRMFGLLGVLAASAVVLAVRPVQPPPANAAVDLIRLRDFGLSLGMSESEVRNALGDSYELQIEPPDEPRIDPPRYSKAFFLRRDGAIVGEVVFGNDTRLTKASAWVLDATKLTPKEFTQSLAIVLADFAPGDEPAAIEVSSNKLTARQPDNTQIIFSSGDRTLTLMVYDFVPEASQRVTLVESVGEI